MIFTVVFSEAIKVSDIVIALFISAANDANGIHGVVPSIASVMPTEINFLNFLCIKSKSFRFIGFFKNPDTSRIKRREIFRVTLTFLQQKTLPLLNSEVQYNSSNIYSKLFIDYNISSHKSQLFQIEN